MFHETSGKIVKVTVRKCCGEEKVQKEHDFKMQLNGFAQSGWQVADTGRPGLSRSQVVFWGHYWAYV